MPARYLIQAPTETYNGKTLGLKFNRGITILEPLNLPKHLGRTVKQTVDLFKRDFPKYTVTEINAKMEETGEIDALPVEAQALIAESQVREKVKGK